jgi:metal-responsive CopG/Arc/MetJ family transcriptional regulator
MRDERRDTMKLPKVRITLDLEHELFEWIMRKVEKTGNSRNGVIGEIIQKAMEGEENEKKLDKR